ncbi:MAG: hypothetical protein MUC60_13045 [Oscillatoria sp. Prado101]|nr:hypothetical protein [Oscillatoria sp. Prado101]
MRIRCMANTGASLPENYLNQSVFITERTEFNLTVGKEYIVYAFYEWKGEIWYYICDDNYTYYPMQNPAPLFEVVDDRVSKYWRVKLSPKGLLEIAFEEWFADPYFYDKLTDQEEAEVSIFEKVKERMDAEALSSQPSPAEGEPEQQTSPPAVPVAPALV